MELKKVKIGDYLETISDYHANGSYQSLKKNITPDLKLKCNTKC